MAKPLRTAQPLPRYVERRPLKTGGWCQFFHVPSKYKRKGCPLHDERLGLRIDRLLENIEMAMLGPYSHSNPMPESERVRNKPR